jgi:putative oxidoreductase
MQPDAKNTWMNSQLGSLAEDPETQAEMNREGAPAPIQQRKPEMSASQDVVFFLTRVVFAFLFACHGAMKLFGSFGGHPMIHHPLMLTAGILEFGGGIMIGLGFFTRPVAFLLCGEMAVAYFKQHFPVGFWPITNHGEPAVLYCFFYLYLAVRGAGRISIDGARGKA